MQHADQGGHHEDHSGVQLAQPGHDDARPAHIVGDGGGQDAGGAHLEGGSQADEGGGQEHGPQDDGIDLHAGVPGRTGAVAYNGNLIAMLGIAQIYKNQDADEQGQNHADVQRELDFAADTKLDPTSTTQSRVNASRINLIEAMQALKPKYIEAVGDTIIDSTPMYIFNIGTETDDIYEYISVVDGYSAIETFYDGADYIGTGTIVDIVGENQDVVATYTFILYGDTTGDGIIDDQDVTAIYDYLDGYALDKFAVGGAFFKAADVNRNGVIDEDDITVIEDYINGDGIINQN